MHKLAKCMLLSFHRRSNPLRFAYHLNGTALTSSSSHKHLGVHLTSSLSWATHVAYATKSANRSLGFLKRNLALTPSHLNLLSYKTVVRRKLEFASSIGYPHLPYLSTICEALPNCAVRFLYSDHLCDPSVAALKSRGNVQDFVLRRELCRFVLFHKLYSDTINYGACLSSHHSPPSAQQPSSPSRAVEV